MIVLIKDGRGCARFRQLLRPQADVHFFQRSEEAHERLIQVPRPPPRLPEIAGPELVSERNDCRPQRTVFVRALGPRETWLGIDPQREPHTVNYEDGERFAAEPLAPECAPRARD